MEKKLALLGGKPILQSSLPEPHHIGKKEVNAALRVLKTGRLSGFVAKYNEEFLGGPWVKGLEKRFSDYFGANYAVSMNSATSCLYAAAYALGIRPGDEVVVPAYTMSATATAILACSGVPVFADIDINNFCIDADKIEGVITSKTKAIIAVHLFGNPARMDKIVRIAKKHNLCVIEDCAQAPGAAYRGKFAGRFGDIGVFSLNRHKTIQCGEGGVAVTDDKKLALKLRLIRNHGEDVIDQMDEAEKFNLIGWNYKMTELEAAIGVEQLKKLNRLNSLRIKNAEYLAAKLKEFSWIVPNQYLKAGKAVYYRYPFRFIKRNSGIKRSTFAKAMAAEGFPLSEGYAMPIYWQSIYKSKSRKISPYLSEVYKSARTYKKGLCPIAEKLYSEELLLSKITHSARSLKDIDLFILALKKIEDNIPNLITYEKKN